MMRDGLDDATGGTVGARDVAEVWPPGSQRRSASCPSSIRPRRAERRADRSGRRYLGAQIGGRTAGSGDPQFKQSVSVARLARPHDGQADMPSLEAANRGSTISSVLRPRAASRMTVASTPTKAATVRRSSADNGVHASLRAHRRHRYTGNARVRPRTPRRCSSVLRTTTTGYDGRVIRRGRPMTLRLSDEQRDLRDAVRELADERIAPRAAAIDASAEFPWDVVELLASHDILALPFPVEHGGLGGDLLSVCLAIEQISRACATSGLILAVHALGSLPLLLAGTPEQRGRWVPDLAAVTRCGLRAHRVRVRGPMPVPLDRGATRRRRVAHRRRASASSARATWPAGGHLRRHRHRRGGRAQASRHLTCFFVEKGTPGFTSAARRAQDRHPRLDDGRARLRRSPRA